MDREKLLSLKTILEKRENEDFNIEDVKIMFNQAITEDDDYFENFYENINNGNLNALEKTISDYFIILDNKDFLVSSNFSEIKYEEESYRIKNIIRDYLDNKFIMPDFQRKYVWTKEQASSLILSSMLGIPIPTVYSYSEYDEESHDDKIYIVDGQQRITSILFYYYGIFPSSIKSRKKYDSIFFKLCDKRKILNKKLKNKDISLMDKDLMKKSVEEIERKLKKYNVSLNVEFKTTINKDGERKEINISEAKIEKRSYNSVLSSKLKFTTISNFKDFEDLVELFNIYNSGGKPLLPQEIRKCIYYKNSIYQFIDEYTNEIPKDSCFSMYKSNEILSSQSKIFKMLSFYFNITNVVDNKTYKRNLTKIKDIFNKEFSNVDISYKNNSFIISTLDESISKKGNVSDSIISEYSKYISKKENEIILEQEINSIKNFFNLNFCRKRTLKDSYVFKNIICIYIILRIFNKLSEIIEIPIEAISFELIGEYGGLLEEERLKLIFDILVNKKIIRKDELND